MSAAAHLQRAMIDQYLPGVGPAKFIPIPTGMSNTSHFVSAGRYKRQVTEVMRQVFGWRARQE